MRLAEARVGGAQSDIAALSIDLDTKQPETRSGRSHLQVKPISIPISAGSGMADF
jgi:hypothetical protein